MFTDLVYMDVLQHTFWTKENNLQFRTNYGPGYLNLYSDSLHPGRSGDRIPVGEQFSAPFHTDPRTQPASSSRSTGSFPGVKRPGRGVQHPPHLAPKLKKE